MTVRIPSFRFELEFESLKCPCIRLPRHKNLLPPGHMSFPAVNSSTHVIFGTAPCDLPVATSPKQFSPVSSAKFSSVSCNKTSAIASPPYYQIPHQASLLSSGFWHLSGSLLWNHLSTSALGRCNLLTFLGCYLHNIKENHKLTKFHKTVPLLPLYANSFSFAGNHFHALIPLDEKRNPLLASSPSFIQI